MRLATHAGKLERWLGAEQIDAISTSMRDWYGEPIALGNVPGAVYACAGGDFRGHCEAGAEASLPEYIWDRTRRAEARMARGFNRWARQQSRITNTGFASLSDLIAEATAGKRREFFFRKSMAASAVGATDSLWREATLPPAGAAASAAPGGTVPDETTTGAFFFTNPTGGDTQHFTTAMSMSDVAGQNLLLYDRLFAVAKTMNSTGTEAVTGVPTRYQSTTPGAENSAEGNFLFMECGTVLPATAHNWTVCTYTDQGGAASTLPSLVGNSSNAAGRLDGPTGLWFAPLESADRGVQTLTQMQCSALVATGAIDFVIGHPLAWFSHPVLNILFATDGINTAFNLVRIFDDAALAFLAPILFSTSTTTFAGSFTTVAG